MNLPANSGKKNLSSLLSKISENKCFKNKLQLNCPSSGLKTSGETTGYSFPLPFFFFFSSLGIKTHIQRFLIILKEQGGMLFTDRLTFTQRTPTFNKLKLLLLMPSEYCLLQKASCFVQVIQKWLYYGYHLVTKWCKAEGRGKLFLQCQL